MTKGDNLREKRREILDRLLARSVGCNCLAFNQGECYCSRETEHALDALERLDKEKKEDE